MPRLTSPSAIVDRKLGAQKAANLRPADKMFIIDSVRDRELPGQHIRTLKRVESCMESRSSYRKVRCQV